MMPTVNRPGTSRFTLFGTERFPGSLQLRAARFEAIEVDPDQQKKLDSSNLYGGGLGSTTRSRSPESTFYR